MPEGTLSAQSWNTIDIRGCNTVRVKVTLDIFGSHIESQWG